MPFPFLLTEIDLAQEEVKRVQHILSVCSSLLLKGFLCTQLLGHVYEWHDLRVLHKLRASVDGQAKRKIECRYVVFVCLSSSSS